VLHKIALRRERAGSGLLDLLARAVDDNLRKSRRLTGHADTTSMISAHVGRFERRFARA
jgi:hypothetical protein